MNLEPDLERRFGGIARLYGGAALEKLAHAHVGVIGIGGVGAWAAEGLARSGVGALTLIDLDHVAESNFNRQIHACDATLGQAKVLAMAERIATFHPTCRVHCVEDFIEPENFAQHLPGLDIVIDAIDSTRTKAALIAYCKAQQQTILTLGGAGGQMDPTQIRVGDLARTLQDPLLSKVRSRLRKEYGFSRVPGKKFGVPAIFSLEQQRPSQASCAPHAAPQGLSCAGYGSGVAVTASFGLAAVSQALGILLAARP